MMILPTSSLLLALILQITISLVQGQANVTGNCVSQRIKFNKERILNLTTQSGIPGSVANPNIDLHKYDMTIDYGYGNVAFSPNGNVDLKIVKSGNVSVGARMSLLRYMLYGKVTFRIKSIPERGAITTGILMSDVKDEIDWEGVGARPSQMESAIFYRGNIEPRGGLHPANGGISTFHDYTIDWTDKDVKWLLDGQLVRTYARDVDGAKPYGHNASVKVPLQPNERIFPNTPALVQIGVWATGPESTWGGGAVDWGTRTELAATYEYIDIQCYDDKMQPVPAWPSQPGPLSLPSAFTQTQAPVPAATSPVPAPSVTSPAVNPGVQPNLIPGGQPALVPGGQPPLVPGGQNPIANPRAAAPGLLIPPGNQTAQPGQLPLRGRLGRVKKPLPPGLGIPGRGLGRSNAPLSSHPLRRARNGVNPVLPTNTILPLSAVVVPTVVLSAAPNAATVAPISTGQPAIVPTTSIPATKTAAVNNGLHVAATCLPNDNLCLGATGKSNSSIGVSPQVNPLIILTNSGGDGYIKSVTGLLITLLALCSTTLVL